MALYAQSRVGGRKNTLSDASSMQFPSNQSSSGQPASQSEAQTAIIDQLGKEIQSGVDIVMSMRTRSAFTIWVGPYIVLGSMLVATKGGFTFDYRNPVVLAALLVAVFCYVSLGYIAGRIERHTSGRANALRRCIISMAETGKIDMNLYLDEDIPRMIVRSYQFAFALLLTCFFGVAVLVSTVRPNPTPSENSPSGKTQTQSSEGK